MEMCDQGHEPIVFSNKRRQCPLCAHLAELGENEALLQELEYQSEEYEAFKERCVCGKLAGE